VQASSRSEFIVRLLIASSRVIRREKVSAFKQARDFKKAFQSHCCDSFFFNDDDDLTRKPRKRETCARERNERTKEISAMTRERFVFAILSFIVRVVVVVVCFK
jgi:hypothetical protein